ncbi:Holliday junction resolvase RecU [Aciduricibacillus chroicocephali]|uniref:Holliday junction resolvase RecU n=1 Tax=Aciduricibacillus chroicocephali TaxID=3054939 RepID=A0ABY9KYH0_9BACI|nr:Holliday junction resolvase RecU [Bacillaceae bacterium 44XB]
MNYPNGKRPVVDKAVSPAGSTSQGYGNRGMTLEEDINATNAFYRSTGRGLIHKKPTPVQIVNVHYPKRTAAVITEAYFKQPSTTDYNGVYKGRHIDFEAKETKNKTSFPLSNIHEHQIAHMEAVIKQEGICFMIIRFASLGKTFYFSAESLLESWAKHLQGGRKSISYNYIEEAGHLIPFGYQARIDYLSIVDKLYF